MPWCLECNKEYLRGFSECSECGGELVEDKDQVDENQNEPTLLMTAMNEYEAIGIKTLLESARIPVMFVHKTLSGHITVVMGTSQSEVDIMVPKSSLDDAKALLEATPEPEGIAELYEEDYQDDAQDLIADEPSLVETEQANHEQENKPFSVVKLLLLIAVLIYVIVRLI